MSHSDEQYDYLEQDDFYESYDRYRHGQDEEMHEDAQEEE